MKNRLTRPFGRAFAIICVAGCLAVAGIVAAAAAEPKLGDLGSVLNQLRQGGFVIYFRHAATERTGANDEAADLEKCETQRALSDIGRAQAVQIGEGMKRLRIPIGQVISSPFCRCKDTATLAFGRVTVDKGLYFALVPNPEEVKRLAASTRKMLSTAPAPGTNTVLVSHTANLREAAGIWPKHEGMAYVFRPLGDGKFEPVAMVLPEDWLKVASSQTSAASQ